MAHSSSNDFAYDSAVAIIGMAGRFPGANTPEQLWHNLVGGVKSIRRFSDAELLAAGVDPDLLRQPNYVKAGTVIDNVDSFDAAFFGFTPREAEVIDPQLRLFLECAWEALEDAGHDPERHDQLTGVFAGAAISTYLFNNIFTQPELMELVGPLLVGVFNSADSLASTLAYKFNFKGPSITLQTFCSTSLVAVHLACQSLLNYECDMALAGGVAISVPHGTGYLYQEGGITSPDGECRTFDARGQGSVMSNGAGIVVLKRLDQAIEDGDSIYAVIRGSATNNDGTTRVGYTAPGLDGQAAVISEALAHADIAPETISYLEAHGTATALGDSIELAASIKAFRKGTQKQQFCAIGSVKPNVGHLDRASGVTGLIKTALALKHRLLPSSLNFERTSPDIDLPSSPFYVNMVLKPWEKNGAPRRAGVSSFGIGGTNAHIILQETPELEPSDPAKPYQLLVLSAKTATALDTATANLAAYLREHSDLNLADVAGTLQLGRGSFNYRRALVCRDLPDAVERLTAAGTGRHPAMHQTNRDRPVAFLFPGVGVYSAGMARELYDTAPAFAETVDRCCALLRPHLGLDLREVLYPNDRRPTTDDPFASAQGRRRPTTKNQPSWLENRGLKIEDSTIDASEMRSSILHPPSSTRVGGQWSVVSSQELEQTWLAEPAVFVVEYALARLLIGCGIQPQAMLGDGIGELVAACLAGVLSLEDALKLLATRARLIAAQPEGALPGAIAGELTALARTLALHPPAIPYVSNVTGAWITAEQATDPGYWARHMLQTVRLADGVATLLQGAEQVLVEVGSGQALSSFVKEHPAYRRDTAPPVLSTLPGAHDRASDRAALLDTLGKLWQAGVTVDWAGLHQGERRRRVSLPTYPFERQRYWIEPAKDPAKHPAPAAEAGKRVDPADWFYAPTWHAAPLPAAMPATGTVLIFIDSTGLGTAAATWIEQAGRAVVRVYPGDRYERIDAHQFRLRPGSPADYQSMVESLRAGGQLPRTILHLWGVPALESGAGPERFQAAQQVGFYSLLGLAQALGRQALLQPVQLLVVTSGVQSIRASDRVQPEAATLLGLGRVIGQENLSITCRFIDVALPEADHQPSAVAGLLAAECAAATNELVVAYRESVRYVQQYTPVRLEAPAAGAHPPLRQRGVYLITGGFGGVGLLLAEHMARTAQARLALVGRTGLPDRAEWADWLASHAASDSVSRKIARIQALEAHGAEVLILSADAGDEAQMRAAIAQTLDRFGQLNGVLHAAGISDVGTFKPIQEIGPLECEQHFRAKGYGLYSLEQALAGQPLDFCLLFSSISAVLGGIGFAGYAAANSFMDAFTRRHNQDSQVPWISVNWDTWRLDVTYSETLGATVARYEMSPDEGIQAFERVIINQAHTQLINSTGDLDARIRQWVLLESVRQAADDAAGVPVNARRQAARPGASGAYEQRIAGIWQQVLGLEEVGLHDNFFDIGGNSLIALQVIAKLKKEFDIPVPAVALFEAPTVSALALYLLPELAPEPLSQQDELDDRRQRAREASGSTDVAIIAMVGRFPGARTVEQFWQNLRDGVESSTRFSDQDLLAAGVDPQLIQDPNYVKMRPILEDVDQFDAAFFGYTPREAELMDPQQRLFHEAAWEALETAGYDTQRYPGLIGVFAGANLSMYLIRLFNDPAFASEITDSTILNNDKDGLTTNVSYKLNLKGPSFGVQTFCSTSLVATHLACRSLRAGECDLALAGGVSIRLPVRAGYLYQEGDQVSPDGHVRTFDADGAGATFGDGVAVVVLKRLEDALQDGDTIHAIIKGSAINNDGGLKVGYTAPSVIGQADVIRAALADAQVDPASISYVEAHGTATRLGDPIEVAALTKAYRAHTEQIGFCALSSVKPNVGHLDRAAGATGLIKTVLALKHAQIPPTLHFQRPNPELALESSPFYIPTSLTAWPRNGHPRRAGVNSLGVGGTNAHVVLEEAPTHPPSAPSREVQLLLLSAKTAGALETATANLAAFLAQEPSVELADVAYTLQIGRRVFEHRRVLVCRDREEALRLLAAPDRAPVRTAQQAPLSRPMAFLFGGVGDHYAGMAEQLYQSESSFRATIDRCCAILQPHLGLELRSILYPDHRTGDRPVAPTTDHRPLTNGGPPTNGKPRTLDLRGLLGRNGSEPDATDPLHRTELAQPAVFVVEYALAQLLISWGIQPAAMLGYSVGEYVAACLSGVLSLEDALKLVATRARLIATLPAGAMLAVMASEAQVQPFLREGVELAIVNGPQSCVLAGPPAAIDALAQQLAEQEIACRSVPASHAFHTGMLAPIADELTALVRTLKLHPPAIPYISNVTGTWITTEQATDPAYWARHMLETVRFAEGVAALLATPEQVLVEVGAGQALSSFVKGHPACERARFNQVIATLPGAQERGQDLRRVLETIGALWLLDVSVDAGQFYAQEQRRRVPLPTYPFERRRFWVEPRGRAGMVAAPAAPMESGRKPDLADWFYTPMWVPAPLPVGSAGARGTAWVVLANEGTLGAQVAGRLAARGHVVVRVREGLAFEQVDAQTFVVRPAAREDYQALLAALARQGTPVSAIAHLWNSGPEVAVRADAEGFRAAQERGLYSLLALVQALGERVEEAPVQLVVGTYAAQPVTGDEALNAELAPMLGITKIIGQEHLSFTCRSVDLLLPAGSDDESALLDSLADELSMQPADLVVAYRNGQRWVQQFHPARLEPVPGGISKRLRKQGVYLITGGLGGIGLHLARYLARTVQAKLVLIGRSGLPARAAWAAWQATHPTDDPTSQRIAQVLELETLGAEVLVLRADVSDEAAMRDVLAQTQQRFGPLNGLIHAAGNLNPADFGSLQQAQRSQCENHFQPKVYGLYLLERLLEGYDLDFCLLLSSVSAVLGGIGYGGYTAANFFMDIFTHRHNQRSAVPWISVNWDTWHLKDGQHDTIGATVAQYELWPDEGCEAFCRILELAPTQIINSTGDLDTRIRQWVLMEALRAQETASSRTVGHARPALETAYVPPTGKYEQRIAGIWQQVLGLEEVGLHDNFFELGGNSLIALQVIARLKKEFKLPVPAVALFEAPTVSALALYLLPEQPAAVDQQQALLEQRRAQAQQTSGSADVAIIAMAGRFPGAPTVAQLWRNLRDGVESRTAFSDEELLAAGVDPQLIHNPNYVKRRPILEDVDQFDAGFFGYTPREAELMDPQQRLFHEVAWEAIETAGYDTQRYPGLVGVFAGANISTYLMRILSDPTMAREITDGTILDNNQDGLTTNVSYKLNLKGPSFGVQTFCSTSLVATHLACRSLRNGECDLALAGGVSIRVPDKAGYMYQQGDQVSPDGCCRTFDEQSEGTIFGDGAAVVVLKRFADALQDGDTILAVIKGSAINNDGGLKVGYTAPSVIGQADVIRAALADAQVDPASISYVEAHGTATKLGDPIEVAALTKAYRAHTEQVGYCALSSVKPNVGHLDRAAGATGLIKTVLALRHAQIPPTLHFQRPNPELALESSPFYVPASLTTWPRNGHPRRAGVNSLGVGGTNAHVVLEEAPPVAPSAPSRTAQLLVLSAKTASALETATANLAAFLAQEPNANLADVAYTLQVGRRVFEHRRALVCHDRAEALRLLATPDRAPVRTAQQAPLSRPVAFLFGGVGDHYAGMAEQLYHSETSFRATIDRCCAILQPHLGLELRSILYPDHRTGDRPVAPTTDHRPLTNGGPPTNGKPRTLDLRTLLGRNGSEPGATEALHRTELAQPAVFVVEYALAQLLIGWGVRPAALLGYSVGEYVAACLSGVLSLEDALKLVATRARLIAGQPHGAMLAVMASEVQVQPFLREGVELAIVNGPQSCVLAGSPAAIDALAQQLAQQEIAYRPVPTSHAFHTGMLAPIAAELTALVRTLKLHPPTIPYISNVTGTWITAEQATDPAYWARHMLETVRFSEGVAALLATPEQVLVEVGAGQALSSFVKGHPECPRARFNQVIATLPGAQERGQDLTRLLEALGALWLLDVPLDSVQFYAQEQRRRVPLPTYPFERRRFWVEPQPYRTDRVHDRLVRRADIADWFSAASWTRSSLPKGKALEALEAERQHWLILSDPCGVGDRLGAWLIDHHQDVTIVVPGAAFGRISANSYTVRPASQADYESLFQELRGGDAVPAHIVHLWTVTTPFDDLETPATASRMLEAGFYSLLALAQALGDSGQEACRISIISNDMQEVIGSERLCPAKSTIIGPCKIISQEYPQFVSRSIDIALAPGGRPDQALIGLLAREIIAGPATEDLIALRGPYRWVQTYTPVPQPAPGETENRLRRKGVYLITGGLGGIGLALAEHLAETVDARLVLVGRTSLPPRSEWAGILEGPAGDEGVARRIKAVLALEARGTEVLVVQADVADAIQVQAAVRQAIARFSTVHGVFHTAGVPGVGIIQLKTAAAAAGVLAPKVQGTLNLAQALRDLPLDFMVLFSSITSATGGGPGQIDYCAANAFLDAYARYRNAMAGPTIAISWGEWLWDAWSAGLQGYDETRRALLVQNRQMYGIGFAEGMDALRRALACDLPHVFVSTQDLAGIVEMTQRAFAAANEPDRSSQTLHPRPELATSYAAPGSPLEEQLAAIWSSVLGIEQVGTNDNFFDLGGNSLLGIELISRMRKALNLEKLQTYVLYDAPTVSALAAHIGQSRQEPVAVQAFKDRADKLRKNLKQFKRPA